MRRQKIRLPCLNKLFLCGLLALSTKGIAQEPIFPISYPQNYDRAKVMLGKKLFHDPRLFGQKDLSCATCHDLKSGGSFPAPLGHFAQNMQINVPTVYNTSLNFRWRWDGAAESLHDQLHGVMAGLVGKNGWQDVVARLEDSPAYYRAFMETYGEVSTETVMDAIISYEEVLITPSPFDAWLKGDEDAISETAKAGYRKFKEYGCVSCHQGKNIGGNLFQPFGIVHDYFSDRKLIPADLGRFNDTGLEKDKHVFKVPSLRNVARTAPYFHNGLVGDLGNAVRIITYYQLGRVIPNDDVELILAFLNTLSGEPLEELLP